MHGLLESARLYRSAELRRLEALAAEGLAPGTLMQRAGQSAADWIDAWLAARAGAAEQAEVLILCGPGNNGGDGFACAEALQRLGRRCVCWSPQASGREDARAARARWEQSGGTVREALPDPGGVAVAVDALFGIGMARPLEGPYLDALRWVRAHGLALLALDLPSGIDADTGAWVGGVVGAPALATITFLGDKPGLHTLEGIDAAGAVTVAPLGVSDADVAALGLLNGPSLFRGVLAARPSNSNKGDFGTVDVIGGAPGMVGAALLAARAALRLGAGKVFVDPPGAGAPAVDALQPELMFRTSAQRLAPGVAAEVLVIGCGLGTDDAARARVALALEHAGPIVVDADALNLVAAHPALRARLAARAPGATVLTPHPGEAGRLLGLAARDVQQDRVGRALALAREFASVVILKGAGTVVALPPELHGELPAPYAINPTGGPALAGPGTGDVLAGMTGALLAQSAASARARIEAVLAAVWLHGKAADDYGADIGLVASEIAARAARALACLRQSSPHAGKCAGRNEPPAPHRASPGPRSIPPPD